MIPKDFLRLLKNAIALVGNSSAGIRECAFLGVKSVNIGKRQNGRDRGKNVVDADYDRIKIKAAILELMSSEICEPDYLYGKGDSGKKIAEILAEVELRYYKKLYY
tara:strand:- start:1383 stop:1700 length:318 start_codon:yes stop_codon:yes gene_type:complete